MAAAQAQRRFRERQKSLIGDLRESVSTLTRETEAQSKQIFVLQVPRRPQTACFPPAWLMSKSENDSGVLCVFTRCYGV